MRVRSALAVVLATIVVVGGAVAAGSALVGGEPSEVLLVATDAGAGAFVEPDTTVAAVEIDPAAAIGSQGGGGLVEVAASAAGLFQELPAGTCAAGAATDALDASGTVGVFAEALGVAPGEVADLVGELTGVALTNDTRVTATGLLDGEATSFQAVLERGSAVLIDDRGVPAVRCTGFQPLAPPEVTDDEEFVGLAWTGFDPDRIVEITPADAGAEIVIAPGPVEDPADTYISEAADILPGLRWLAPCETHGGQAVTADAESWPDAGFAVWPPTGRVVRTEGVLVVEIDPADPPSCDGDVAADATTLLDLLPIEPVESAVDEVLDPSDPIPLVGAVTYVSGLGPVLDPAGNRVHATVARYRDEAAASAAFADAVSTYTDTWPEGPITTRQEGEGRVTVGTGDDDVYRAGSIGTVGDLVIHVHLGPVANDGSKGPAPGPGAANIEFRGYLFGSPYPWLNDLSRVVDQSLRAANPDAPAGRGSGSICDAREQFYVVPVAPGPTCADAERLPDEVIPIGLADGFECTSGVSGGIPFCEEVATGFAFELLSVDTEIWPFACLPSELFRPCALGFE
ncbi:MAG: DUF6777 domain-containing protein [Actinomycetota bacterium]